MAMQRETSVPRTIARSAVRTVAAIVILAVVLMLGFFAAWHLGLLGHCGPDDPPAHAGH